MATMAGTAVQIFPDRFALGDFVHGVGGDPSVHELIRMLEADKFKMKILGLDSLPIDNVFSRFKTRAC